MHVCVLFTCWSDTALVDDGTCSKCYKNTLREEGKSTYLHIDELAELGIEALFDVAETQL